MQEIRKNKRRLQKKDELNPFSGMVYCADCRAKMYLSRRINERLEQEHMRCSTYAKDTKECTVHYIRTCVLREIVLSELNKLLFVQTAMSNSVQKQYTELAKAKKTLKQAEKRISKLDKLFKRLYEDNVLGKISDERFEMLSAEYEEEQKQLKFTVAKLTAFIDTT